MAHVDPTGIMAFAKSVNSQQFIKNSNAPLSKIPTDVLKRKASIKGFNTTHSNCSSVSKKRRSMEDGGTPSNTTSLNTREITIARVSSIPASKLARWSTIEVLWNDEQQCKQTLLVEISKALIQDNISLKQLCQYFYHNTTRSPLANRIFSHLYCNIQRERPYIIDCALLVSNRINRNRVVALWDKLCELYKGYHKDLNLHLVETYRKPLCLNFKAVLEYKEIKQRCGLGPPILTKINSKQGCALPFLSIITKTPKQEHTEHTIWCKIIPHDKEFKAVRYESGVDRIILLSQLKGEETLVKLNPHTKWLFQRMTL
uniref:Uncharacterized protein n=1 Tax=Ranid herpesvirus 4 TaxID=2849006 RepID=A0A8F3CIL1_9VIRU|nr:MAG: hypothetical protein [Ranid herpesvirus 4]